MTPIKDRFLMGFYAAHSAPICNEEDDSLYNVKQCNDYPIGSCSCVDPESGDPSKLMSI